MYFIIIIRVVRNATTKLKLLFKMLPKKSVTWSLNEPVAM